MRWNQSVCGCDVNEEVVLNSTKCAKCIEENSFDAKGNCTKWEMFDDSLVCIQNTLRRKSVHKWNWPFGKYVLIYWNWYFSHFAEQKSHKMICVRACVKKKNAKLFYRISCGMFLMCVSTTVHWNHVHDERHRSYFILEMMQCLLT